MGEAFDIQAYMTKGVERVVADTLRATLKNPKESLYMTKFAASSRRASGIRKAFEEKGEHIPPFLIASITSSCNLHCAGCYSRCNQATTDEEPVKQLSRAEWSQIFDEARELGISFILLAGGEPLLRKDVIEEAGERPDILFPVFTNGTFLGESYLQTFDQKRNLVPILSIEGGREITDERRGEGVYDKLMNGMGELNRRGLIFGVSVTVTTENVREVSDDRFIQRLMDLGCRAVVFVEFVPVTKEAEYLAPGEKERAYLAGEIGRLRECCDEMVFISFPGDEKSSGGCVAAGRGFFHINSHGGAEPCPFSPYSDTNVRETSLREALHSKLFQALQKEGVLVDEHKGGCVLYEKRELVEKLSADSQSTFP